MEQPRKRITVVLPEGMLNILDKECAKRKVSCGSLVRLAVGKLLEGEDAPD